MGQQCVRQRPSIMNNNTRDQINHLLTINNGCQPLGSTYLKQFIPQNDEYEWVGDGESCYYCSFDPGSEVSCSAGCDGIDCCSIIGRRGVYKRKRYLAKELDCCISGLPEIMGKTCDPTFQTKETCEPLLRDLCTHNNSDIFDKDVCKKWCNDMPQQCETFKLSVCNNPDPSNVNECLNFCMNNMGKCDRFMNSYCEKNPTDQRCSCYNSTQLYNPLCVDKKCIDSGYQSLSMLSSRGDACKIIDCKAKLDIQSEGKVNMKDIVIDVSCGEETHHPIISWKWIIMSSIVIFLFLLLLRGIWYVTL